MKSPFAATPRTLPLVSLVFAGCASAPAPAPAPTAPLAPAPHVYASAAPEAAPAPPVVFPDASPGCELRQRIGLTDIDISYSRPGVKGRLVFGGILPYGAVWRTGANSSTKITFSTDVELDGHPVPRGAYALYSIPNRNVWTIILDKDTHLWGAYGYDSRSDFLRFDVRPVALLQRVETFTIEFANIKDDNADLDLAWEHTLVPIHVTVDVVPVVSAEIDRAMADGRPKKVGFYINAASFYYQHGPDLDKALQMADAAIALNTPATFEAQFIKAEVLAQQGDKAGAAAAARESRAGALKNDGPTSSYLRMNDDLLARVGQ